MNQSSPPLSRRHQNGSCFWSPKQRNAPPPLLTPFCNAAPHTARRRANAATAPSPSSTMLLGSGLIGCVTRNRLGSTWIGAPSPSNRVPGVIFGKRPSTGMAQKIDRHAERERVAGRGLVHVGQQVDFIETGIDLDQTVDLHGEVRQSADARRVVLCHDTGLVRHAAGARHAQRTDRRVAAADPMAEGKWRAHARDHRGHLMSDTSTRTPKSDDFGYGRTRAQKKAGPCGPACVLFRTLCSLSG